MAKIDILKEKLGEELFSQVSDKLKDDEMEIVDIKGGAYVPKADFDSIKGQYDTLNTEFENLKAIPNQTSELTKKLDEITKNHQAYKEKTMIENAFLKNGITNEKVQKSIIANMDTTQFKFDSDTLGGFDEQLSALKEDEIFRGLFGATITDTPKGGNPPNPKEQKPKNAFESKFNQMFGL